MRTPQIVKIIFNKYFFQKLFAWLILASVAYFFRDFFVIFLMTFLFAYLFSNFGDFIRKRLMKLFSLVKNKGLRKWLEKFANFNFLVLLVYLCFIGAIVFIPIPKLLSSTHR